MAKDKKEERNLSLNDIRGAMAEEHPERDAGLNAFMAMASDTMEEQQPDGTYRFALNAVNEDRNEAGRLQNEESNEECFRIKDIEAKGEIIAALCCKRLVRFEYTESDISSKISALVVGCEEYVHTGYWSIDGEGHYSTAQLIIYLASNVGMHRIVAECYSTDITIKVIGCCKDTPVLYVTAHNSMQITLQFVTEMFEQCATPYIVLGDQDGYIVQIGTQKFTEAQLPTTVTQDSTITILCSDSGICDCLDSVELESEVAFDGGMTAEIEENTDFCDEKMYSLSSALEDTDSVYIALSYGDCIINGVSLQVNDITILQHEGYNNSLDEYWYFDGDGHIILKLNALKNDVYKISVFVKDWCGEYKEMCLEIRKKVILFSQDGTNIGYVVPDSIISLAENETFVIDGSETHSIFGSTYDGDTVDEYYLKNSKGEEIKVAFDGHPIDFRYNNSIKVHLS